MSDWRTLGAQTVPGAFVTTDLHEAPSVAAVDVAIARLATEVARMDGTDLAAPWTDERPSRRDLVHDLLAALHADGVEDTDDGRTLAAALTLAWSRRRQRLLSASTSTASETSRLLRQVHGVRVALDAGVDPHDVRGLALTA